MNSSDTLFIRVLQVVLLLNLIITLNARADDLNFRSRFLYNNSDTETTDKATGEVATSEFSEFNQRYSLDFSKTLFPYLTLKAGTIYELNHTTTTSQAVESERDEEILRPFASLDLNNPIYRAGLGFRQIQVTNKTTGIIETKDFRDEINTSLGWRPSDLPELRFNYFQTHTYDEPKTVDVTEAQLTFDARYKVWKDLGFDYNYTRIDRENRISNLETLDQTHNGKIAYSHDFFDRRLSLDTSYRIRYNTFEFPTNANTEFPLQRSRGLSALDDTPLDQALDVNPLLIDGDLIPSAGLNLGLNGDETTLTNIGLDFGFPVAVDRVQIWVSGFDLRPSDTVVASFSWSVYTSSDNEDWVLHASGLQGSFGPFEDRFDIPFSEVTTRYIKVVTRPLSPIVPDAAVFPNIFVTEMQAFTTLSGQSAQNQFTQTDQGYNLNLRGRVSDKMLLGYNLFYSSQEKDPSAQKNEQLSNGLNLAYVFDPIFSASASISQSDRQSNDEKTTDNSYAASLRAAYLKTLVQTLTYSGTKTQELLGTTTRDSVFLHTNADLYKGWSAFVDVGYTWRELLEGLSEKSTIFRSGTNIVPHQKLTLNMNYSLTETQNSDESIGRTSNTRWDVQAFFIPFNALSFNGRISLVEQGEKKTNLYNYSANWSPFSDGTLQFFFAYIETLRPEEDYKSRSIGPSLKWKLSRHFFVDMSYSITESENPSQISDSENFSAQFRVIF